MSLGGWLNRLIKKYPLIALSIAIILTGSNSFIAKNALEEIPPMLYIGIRFYVVGVVLLLIGWGAGHKLAKRDYRNLGIQIFIQSIVGFSWFIGLSLTQAVNSSIMFLLTPIAVYIGSVLFLGEPRSNRALTGSLVALVGGILLFGAPVLSGGSDRELLGNGLLLVAAISFAALVLHSKKIVSDRNLFTVFGTKFFAVAHLHLLASLLFEDVGSITSASTSALSSLAFASTFTGFVGIYLFYKSLEYVKGEEAAPLFYLDPLVGSLGGVLLLGEVLSDAALFASGVIIAGVIISHPVHLNRYLYYQKYSHTKFEEFLHWIKKEYQTAYNLVKKFF